MRIYSALSAGSTDGRLAELFLTNHKAGSHADTAARDSAITFSIAVQHGADPETIRLALSNGTASGPLASRSISSSARMLAI